MLITFSITLGTLFSYRRGLRSCLSLQGGKFEGQEREISDKHESHAFFYTEVSADARFGGYCNNNTIQSYHNNWQNPKSQ